MSLGGINPLNIATQAFLASATGGGSLAFQVASSGFMSQMGQSFLQGFGQALGLPQPIIDMAQAQFAGSMGDASGVFSNLQEASGGLSSAVGGGSFEAGQLQRQAQDHIEQWMETSLEQLREGRDEEGGVGNSRGKARGGESFLLQLARVMGQVLDAKMEEMVDLGKQLDDSKASGGSNTGELTARISALGQEMGMIANAVNTSIKSAGEAAATLARKQ